MVLGGGRVGSAIVRDLTAENDFDVLVVDIDPVAVENMTHFGADGVVADLSQVENVSRAVQDADLVVGAVPGFMGYRTVKRVLQEGRPIVDISFFEEDSAGLEELAETAGVPCLVDCGVAPGLSNLVLGNREEHFDDTELYVCLAGGLPKERVWPWEYKAPFSPADVIAEYVRPARQRRAGREVTKPALTDVELIDIPGVGSLEAFNTDGLRSLLRTCSTPNMVEKTLRYPGHANQMKVLREGGFFSSDPIQAASGSVIPRDVTESLLFDAWRFDDGDLDLTVLRIVVEGTKDGQQERHTYNLVDHYNPATDTMSMARTTGYTCTAMASLVARGLWTQPGLATPEIVGRNQEAYDAVIAHLRQRDVYLDMQVEAL
ncbi:MAG: saccharopine dehydrogenase family protein [Longimicrobiales bacterium]